MIGSLTKVNWKHRPGVVTTDIEPDYRLSQFLTARIKGGADPDTTFGDWVMNYHPSEDCSVLSKSLVRFLKLASGSSRYKFDRDIATIFHNLLLSTLYAYLCLMAQINKSLYPVRVETDIEKYVGLFSNAIRIFYLVSHSNAMKAFFTYVKLPVYTPMVESKYFKNIVDDTIKSKIGPMDDVALEPNNNNDEGANYTEDFSAHRDTHDEEVGSIYRRSLMSFVDHFAGIFLLQRRSSKLPASETIKLSLIAVRPPRKSYYFSWDVMENVIRETCKSFRAGESDTVKGESDTVKGESDTVKSEDVIIKIKEFLQQIPADGNLSGVIFAFKTLLKAHEDRTQLSESQYPIFNACIHCESSIAAILCLIHGDDWDRNEALSTLFKASSSFITLIFDHSC